MNRWEGKVAIVTGASAGIGAAIAKELVRAGMTVVGLARRMEKLEELSESLKEARGRFYARKCDLSIERELLDAFEWVNAELGGVDILVNNAGISQHRRIIDDNIDSFRNILNVNLLASAISLREAVASMKSRDVEGYIIVINSVLGHQFPDASFKRSLYVPTKHALKALTEVVRKELAAEANNKIRITSISPGFVKTDMARASGSSEAMYKTAPFLYPEDIADTVLYVLGTPHRVQVKELTVGHMAETL